MSSIIPYTCWEDTVCSREACLLDGKEEPAALHSQRHALGLCELSKNTPEAMPIQDYLDKMRIRVANNLEFAPVNPV